MPGASPVGGKGSATGSAPGTYSVALTGDVILNTRVSVCDDQRVLGVVDLLRGATVGYAHLELPLHDFNRADAFPAAEGALSWMSGPTSIASELSWCGVDVVSTASNHAFDYSYGGMASTLAALDAASVGHAGSGANLGLARAPAFVESSPARIALVSATTAFPTFARAGSARDDVIGRPGVNTIRHHHIVDSATADDVISLCSRLGLWVTEIGDEFAVSPAGMFNTLRRFVVDPAISAPTTACDEDDLAGNLTAIRYAAAVADFVVVHLHTHDWNAADGRLCTTPAYVEQFANAAVEAGASVVVVQGSHAPIRGIAIVRSVPVFYDPGPLFRLGRRDRQPDDFYTRWGSTPAARERGAGPLEAFAARDGYFGGSSGSPREGVAHHPGAVLPVCTVDAHTHRVRSIALHPLRWLVAPQVNVGFPALLDGNDAEAVLAHIGELSAPYGTSVRQQGSRGYIDVAPAHS